MLIANWLVTVMTMADFTIFVVPNFTKKTFLTLKKNIILFLKVGDLGQDSPSSTITVFSVFHWKSAS